MKAKEIILFITIIIWATLVGGVVYSHIAFFPSYLSHLPESTKLITGDYAIHDESFWMLVHPLAILFTITTLILNWKTKERRKYILITLGIYVLAIVATAIYFVPGLMAFADSANNTSVSAEQWYERGQTWQHLSWIRGFFMSVGFVMLLFALTKNTGEE